EGELTAQAVVLTVECDLVGLEVLFHPGQRLVRFLVVAEGLGRLVERNLLSQPVREVGQVAQRRGVMSLEDVGVEVLRLPAPYRGDEVGEVVVARTTMKIDLDEIRESDRLGLALGIELVL